MEGFHSIKKKYCKDTSFSMLFHMKGQFYLKFLFCLKLSDHILLD